MAQFDIYAYQGEGIDYLLPTHLLAAIPVAALGQPVASDKTQRNEIVAALDFIFTGI